MRKPQHTARASCFLDITQPEGVEQSVWLWKQGLSPYIVFSRENKTNIIFFCVIFFFFSPVLIPQVLTYNIGLVALEQRLGLGISSSFAHFELFKTRDYWLLVNDTS